MGQTRQDVRQGMPGPEGPYSHRGQEAHDRRPRLAMPAPAAIAHDEQQTRQRLPGRTAQVRLGHGTAGLQSGKPVRNFGLLEQRQAVLEAVPDVVFAPAERLRRSW